MRKRSLNTRLPGYFYLPILACFLFSHNDLSAAEKSVFDLMYLDEIIDVELRFDMDSLFKNKYRDEYIPATFSFRDENENSSEWDIKVKARGKFRLRTCDFPPLKLSFKKKQLKARGLSKHNSIKLVTHCLQADAATDLVFKEYLTYQLYRTISDTGFRTQLVRITYLDVKSGNRLTRFGILIEDEDQMADRLDGELCEDCYGTSPEKIDQQVYHQQALFQFMIGNSDWSIEMLRNIKLVQVDEDRFFVVPYDFDFSGLVNAPYAVPNSDYGLTSNRQRVFLGEHKTGEKVQEAIDLFEGKKKAFIKCIRKQKKMSSAAKQDMLLYLRSFYTFLKNDPDFDQILDYTP